MGCFLNRREDFLTAPFSVLQKIRKAVSCERGWAVDIRRLTMIFTQNGKILVPACPGQKIIITIWETKQVSGQEPDTCFFVDSPNLRTVK